MAKSKRLLLTVLSMILIVGVISPLSVYAADGKGGVFTPTTSYPYSETLIYGNDTVVVDINYDLNHLDTWFFRWQANSDAIHWITRVYSGGKYNYTIFIASNSPIYTYTINTTNGYNGSVFESATMGSAYGYKYVDHYSVSFTDNSKLIYRSNKMTSVPSNLSLGSGVVLVDHYIWTYPSMGYVQSNEQYSKISQDINEGFSMVDNRLSSGLGDVTHAIQQGVSDILNAGTDMPTLDTDNNWMNDSLTKMDEWLNDMSEFEEQLEENKQENAENMSNAGSFLSAFFDTVPIGLICAFTFVLVVIVVVKLIGR